MYMGEQEIKIDYKYAVDKAEQIIILAELNSCDVRDIELIVGEFLCSRVGKGYKFRTGTLDDKIQSLIDEKNFWMRSARRYFLGEPHSEIATYNRIRIYRRKFRFLNSELAYYEALKRDGYEENAV